MGISYKSTKLVLDLERSNLVDLYDIPIEMKTTTLDPDPAEERGEEESETLPLPTTTPDTTLKAGRDEVFQGRGWDGGDALWLLRLRSG